MLVEGHENDVPQDCHYPLGSGVRYHYSITDTQNNVTYCNTSMERWDVCNTTMTFDYSICPYKIAYSGNFKPVIEKHELFVILCVSYLNWLIHIRRIKKFCINCQIIKKNNLALFSKSHLI